MGKAISGFAGFCAVRAFLVLLALVGLCEGMLPRPVRGMPRPISGTVSPRRPIIEDPLLAQARQAIRGPGPTEKVFNVLKYGADASGKKDSSTSFIKAWSDACHWKGKSRLLIPRGNFLLGEVVFQGKCAGRDAKVVEIQGILKALTDPSLFPQDYWILFELIDRIIIIGSGILDGQGASVWKYSDCNINSNCQRMPISLKFNMVKNAIVNKLSSVNSKGFHVGVTNSNNIRLYNIRISAPAKSPNTDGIHISKSNKIMIAKGVIKTGDDCISMIQGSTNIKIQKVFCGPGHGISIGSLGKYQNEADVRGITVRNCTLTGTENGVRIKTWPDSPPSAASNLIFRDIVMKNVKNPIIIDQEYNHHNNKKIISSRVKITDVYYENIMGTSMSPIAISLVCSKQFPCERVHFNNINLRYVGLPQSGPITSTCLNTKAVVVGRVQMPRVCK
ncbi:hypothetical protein SAY86_001490 [Trapa natans]|uniref:Exopolygalacturonase-like n=1 Tax=Trapa natans TaxID=22666 RepID=A0AAN7MRB4_TRANT|nr:hypothetical protein SAY86_001490 [Trapa natans]